jgi:hypothetical protein
MPMEATLLDLGKRRFSLSGTCPHCRKGSVFVFVSNPHQEHISQSNENRYCVAMQCQGCRKYILGIVRMGHSNRQPNGWVVYETHYPIGKPNDDVDAEIPETIANDFKEALRCVWLDCYKATVTMCRRAVQAACLDLKAGGRDLYQQIEDLAAKHKITEPLRLMAHAVRLEGNKGAHPLDGEGAGKPRQDAPVIEGQADPDPTNDGLEGTSKEDAEAVIAFTKEFFHHVYVMPDKLKKYTPAAKTPANN